MFPQDDDFLFCLLRLLLVIIANNTRVFYATQEFTPLLQRVFANSLLPSARVYSLLSVLITDVAKDPIMTVKQFLPLVAVIFKWFVDFLQSDLLTHKQILTLMKILLSNWDASMCLRKVCSAVLSFANDIGRLDAYKRVLTMLLSCGANGNVPDKDGNRALHIVARAYHEAAYYHHVSDEPKQLFVADKYTEATIELLHDALDHTHALNNVGEDYCSILSQQDRTLVISPKVRYAVPRLECLTAMAVLKIPPLMQHLEKLDLQLSTTIKEHLR